MVQKLKYYCDFCGDELPKGSEINVTGELIKTHYSKTRVKTEPLLGLDGFDLCPRCYEELLGKINEIADFIDVRIRRELEDGAVGGV